MSAPRPTFPSSTNATAAKKNHRVLFLEDFSSSMAGAELQSYMADLLAMAGEIYVPAQVAAVSPEPTSKLPGAFFFKALEVVKRHQPSLIVASHVGLAPSAYGLTRLKRIPYVVLAHGEEVWNKIPRSHEWAINRASGIISRSHWTKRRLVDKGFSESHIQVVQPRLPGAYEKLPAPRRAKAQDSVFTLLTVSRLDVKEPFKGQDHVMQALYSLTISDPDLHFRYLIQGDGTDLPRLEALRTELGLEKIVEFLPAEGSQSAFENIYGKADLFVMPSRYGMWGKRWHGESFGVEYLKAAAFGLPSLAYDCGGGTDFIRHGVNGMLVQPDDIGELARILFMLANNRKLVFELGKKSHEMVMTNFTRPAIRKQIQQALENY